MPTTALFEGKVVAITGAASGLGEATARLLVAEGASVVLGDIQDGSFANRWIEENETGRHEFERLRQADHDHLIERVGGRLRAQMPFLNPVEVQAGQAQAAATTPGAAR